MKPRTLQAAAIVIVGLAVFTAGFSLGDRFGRSPRPASEMDFLRTVASSSERVSVETAPKGRDAVVPLSGKVSEVSTPDVLSVEKREAIDQYLRSIPFAFLKQVYLDRQDTEFEKMSDRYGMSKGLNEEEQIQRGSELLETFRRNAGSDAFFTTETEWKLRGGKSIPVRLFARFYSTSAASRFGLPSAAKKGTDLCWSLNAYFRLGEKYAMVNNSGCLDWTAVRERAPFAVIQPYVKALVPYFDSVSVPLPGFGTDGEAMPEWYDSIQSRWASLARVRWEVRDYASFTQSEKDANLETEW